MPKLSILIENLIINIYIWAQKNNKLQIIPLEIMDFNLTEEHLMIQQAARDFAQAELLPGVIERDEHSKFPTEQVKMMADLGFLGMMVDPKYGGSGLDSVSYVLAMTEIAKIDASAAVVMSVK